MREFYIKTKRIPLGKSLFQFNTRAKYVIIETAKGVSRGIPPQKKRKL
jgi:hypothetical protein